MAKKLTKAQINANTKKATLHGEYGKERTRLMRAISRMEQRGYDFGDYKLPQAPKNITQASINRLKNITTNDLYEKAIYIDYETGEFVSGKRGKILEAEVRARKAQETKRLKQKAEQEFWSSSTGKPQDAEPVSINNLPSGGEIIMGNVLDDFIMKLSSDTPTVTNFGSKRLVENYDASEREKTTLLSLTKGVINRDGEEAVGWRLQASGDRVWDLTQYVLFGSDATQIGVASRELADIINGSPLTLSDYADLGYEQDRNEDYEAVE